MENFSNHSWLWREKWSLITVVNGLLIHIKIPSSMLPMSEMYPKELILIYELNVLSSTEYLIVAEKLWPSNYDNVSR